MALRLKEVGFDLATDALYRDGKRKLFDNVARDDYNQAESFYSAPFIFEVMEWLRFKGYIITESPLGGVRCHRDEKLYSLATGTDRYENLFEVIDSCLTDFIT